MTFLRTLQLGLYICTAAFSSMALSNESAFHDIAPDVKIRLISSGEVNKDGDLLVGIELKMPQSTKTYWRVPGETGIPMSVDWSSSKGITQLKMDWPMPTRDQEYSYVDHIYQGDMIFPVHLNVEDLNNAVLNTSIRMGICDEICVPVNIDMSLALETESPSRSNALRIQQALAQVPWPIESTDVLRAPPVFDTTSQNLLFELKGDLVDVSSLIVSTEDRTIIFAAPIQVGPAQYSAKLLMRTDESFLAQDNVRLDFNSIEGPYVAISAIAILPVVSH